MAKRILIFSPLLALALVALLSAYVLPSYVMNLVEHPSDSYVSRTIEKHRLKNPELHTAEYYAHFVPEVLGRLVGLTAFLFALMLYFFTRGRPYLTRFWNLQSTALNLAVFRIAVFSQIVMFDFAAMQELSSLPPEGIVIPPGLGFLGPILPPSPQTILIGVAVYRVLGWAILLGFFTRYLMPVFSIVSFFVLLWPDLMGKIDHYHHLWLTASILALFPCDDALSITAVVRRWRGEARPMNARGVQYGRAFVFTWLMMGAMYFFPGFWKFVAGGWAWALSDNVALKVLAKVYETGTEPVIPIYNYPILCKFGGLGTLALEILYPFAMIVPVTRLMFAAGALFFHEINKLTIQIAFTSLEYYYVSFVDWSRLFARERVAPALPVRIPGWKNGIAGILVGGLYLAGAVGFDSWPWAVYPTFAPLEQPFVNSIEMRVTEKGRETVVRLQENPDLIHRYGSRTRLRSYLTHVMLEQDHERRAKMLRDLFDAWAAHNPSTPTHVEFWQIEVPLRPPGAEPHPYKKLSEFE